jgi:haloalkane dehalogenase
MAQCEQIPSIDPVDRLPRKRVSVLDSEMAFVDVGDGDPVVFLHGNPTSSYLWRNIIPYLAPFRRCLAPDLIGMGQSGKPRSHAYRLADHIRYLDAWFDAIGLNGQLALVGHDWGGVLAFHRTCRFPQTVSSLAYMETFVQSRRWSELSASAGDSMRRIRSAEGERMMLDENAFVEIALPRLIIRRLLPQEMEAYRAPFGERDARLPTLMWPREQPIDGEPEDVAEIVEHCGKWLENSDIPKLFINAEPGVLITGDARAFCRGWRNQQEVTVRGIHFIQEDSPRQIGAALRDFMGSGRLP